MLATPRTYSVREGLRWARLSIRIVFKRHSFFFKLSAGRREDYASLANITNVTTEFAKKFGATRWLCMKHVGVRWLEQWENLKEYFLTFLPKQKSSKVQFSIHGGTSVSSWFFKTTCRRCTCRSWYSQHMSCLPPTIRSANDSHPISHLTRMTMTKFSEKRIWSSLATYRIRPRTCLP